VPSVAPYASIAPIYDQLVGDAGFEPIWNTFRRSCALYKIRFSSAADIGCGTGRFLAKLADGQRRLYGVDRSAAMLRVAARRLAGTGIVLLRQDMTRLDLPDPVELVACNFNTINYLPSVSALQAALENIAAGLLAGGHLIFDVMIRARDAPAMPALRQLIDLPRVKARWDNRPLANREGAVVHMHTCLQQTGRGWACAQERHVQVWWPWPTLERLLSAVGFRLLGRHRLFDHRPPGPSDQWIQVVVGRR